MFNENLPLVAGSTFDFELKWQTEDEFKRLEPVKLTNCEVEFEIRKSSDNSLLLRCSTQDDGITIAPESGEIYIHLTPSKTADHSPENWRDALWEVVVIFPSVDKYSIAWGSASLRRNIVKNQM